MMAVIFFQDVGKYDKATFVCLQHSDCRDKTPEDLPEFLKWIAETRLE